jgi:hypothetical protein
MKTDKSTVFEIFEKHRRYVVPLFQRGYVWNREGQWEPLWDDLIDQTAELVRYRSQPGTRLHKHFLGALVLNLTLTPLSRVPVVDIIDGQQRLTTLQVLLAAIRDEAGAVLDDPYLKDRLQRLTLNTGQLVTPDERFKVWPTSSMQVHVANVMEAGSSSELEELYRRFHEFKYKKWRPPRPGVVEAYLYFSQMVRDYLDDDPEELPFDLVDLPVEQRAHDLIEALIQNIQLVTIELDAEDNAQVIFETLNARGEPLTPSDLVRNFVFLTATRDGRDVTRLYDELWRTYEEDPPKQPFWKEEERQGRLKRSRLDLFLFHYVTFLTGDELKIGHLYQAFRDWWESAERDVENELQSLLRFSKFYAVMLAPDSSTDFAISCRRLRVLDTATAYPLLLWAAGELGTDSSEFLEMLTDVESFLVRRIVCGHNAKAYNRLFLEALGKLRRAGVPTAAGLRAQLGSSAAESAVWPGDDEFRRHLVNDPLYRTVTPRRMQMILQALDHASRHRYSEDMSINSELTIEHVMPQHPSEDDWPLYLKDGENWLDARTERETATHRLGNLTLLTQPLNSSVSNGPYSLKRTEIANSLLALNSYFHQATDWNEAQVDARGEKLADLALRIWPGPRT